METRLAKFEGIQYQLGFKSYYVVWKLNPVIAEDIAILSLNRTMQYGNFLEKYLK